MLYLTEWICFLYGTANFGKYFNLIGKNMWCWLASWTLGENMIAFNLNAYRCRRTFECTSARVRDNYTRSTVCNSEHCITCIHNSFDDHLLLLSNWFLKWFFVLKKLLTNRQFSKLRENFYIFPVNFRLKNWWNTLIERTASSKYLAYVSVVLEVWKSRTTNKQTNEWMRNKMHVIAAELFRISSPGRSFPVLFTSPVITIALYPDDSARRTSENVESSWTSQYNYKLFDFHY